jgi:hypothetical protein
MRVEALQPEKLKILFIEMWEQPEVEESKENKQKQWMSAS